MNELKANEAVKKSLDYKAVMALLAQEQGLTPATLQPEDGFTTPFHRMGVVPSTSYSPYNTA